MFKTDKLEFKNGVWEININYDYPFNGKNHKQAVKIALRSSKVIKEEYQATF